MELKVQLSKPMVEVFDDTVEAMKTWRFDAINIHVFIGELLSAPDNLLSDYIQDLEGADYMDLDTATTCEISDYYGKLLDEAKKALEKEAKAKSEKQEGENASKEETPPEEEDSSEGKKKDDDVELKKQKYCDVIFTDTDGNKHKYPVDRAFKEYIDHFVKVCGEYGITEAMPIHFVVAMFDYECDELKGVLKVLDVEYYAARKYFKVEDILKLGIIPYALSGFLMNLNETINVKKPCEILMRDKEVNQLWNIMSKMNKRNAVIVGEAGVGKSALIERITYDICTGKCPTQFKDFNVISLDVNALIAGTSYRGDAEQRIKDIIDFLKSHKNVILFIDEVHTILGAGSCYEGEMDLANALKPILARGETIVIGATTEDEYEAYFTRDAALTRRFERVTVKEPKAEEVYAMVKNKIKTLSEFHGVKIYKPMVEYVILIANCFNFDKKNPDKTLDLIDRAMVACKRAGRKVVEKVDVLENFGIYFKKWEKMSDEAKLETAYHEIGHYLVGKYSGRLVNLTFLAVSIMPAETYLGVTVYEENDEAVPHANYNYYVDAIAMDLAGRAAENMFTSDYTSGASADLRSATAVAYDVVASFGLTSDKAKNRVYLNAVDFPMYSEKTTNEVNEAIDNLVEIALKRAQEILEENKDILEALVKAIMKNHIMSETQLDKICQNVIAKRNK